VGASSHWPSLSTLWLLKTSLIYPLIWGGAGAEGVWWRKTSGGELFFSSAEETGEFWSLPLVELILSGANIAK
jgi:hypothetical protein